MEELIKLFSEMKFNQDVLSLTYHVSSHNDSRRIHLALWYFLKLYDRYEIEYIDEKTDYLFVFINGIKIFALRDK